MADEGEEEAPDEEDGEEDEDGEGASSGGGGKKKLILILLLVTLVILALIGGGLFMSGLLDPLLGTDETEEGSETVIAKAQFYYKFEDMTVNLVSGGKKSRFFKVGITIVLGSALDIPFVEALAPRIIDNVTAYLRELKPAEITGSANFNQLRENIRLRVRTAVAPTQVSEILFNSALVQ